MLSLSFFAEITLRMTLLGLAGCAASLLLRRQAAEYRYAIWRFVLIGMMALPVLMSIVPPLRLLPPRTAIVMREVTNPLVVKDPPSVPAPKAPSTLVTRSSVKNPAGKRATVAPSEILLTGYLFVAAVMLLRIIRSVILAKRIVSSATRINDDFLSGLYPRPD